jgi:hypothetical protein
LAGSFLEVVMVEVLRVAVAGFKGSVVAGHRDVPELGWWRPTSWEARAAVVLFDPRRD